MLRTGNTFQVFSAGSYTVEPGRVSRTASASTLVEADAGPSPSTMLPGVPAWNGWVPSVVHTPPEPDCWFTV